VFENLSKGQGFFAKICEGTPFFGGNYGMGRHWGFLV